METREEKHNDNKKENEKDMKKRYNKQYKWCNIIFFDWLKNDWRENYLYIDVRYIMDSHHTNKT